MNIVVVMLDSLRRDHLGCYGNKWISTPNIDALAQDSVIFLDAYPEALPTIPIRTSLFTGQRTLPYRPWQRLEDEDITFAEILRSYGYTTALITDTYHLFKPGMNFHRGFDVFRWIRGQEADPYESAPHGKDLSSFMKPVMDGDWVQHMLDQYLKNTAHWTREEDYFAAQVISEAEKWIRKNRDSSPFFLWLDLFDPHEPWDPPPQYEALYASSTYEGPRLILPKYGPTDWMTQQELEYVRSLYAGEVSFVDRCVGRLLETLGDLDLLDQSLVILLSDHGHPHGDHGTIMKTPENLYNELLRIPLMIRFPDRRAAGARIPGILQTHDLLPTVLHVLGLTHESDSMHGRSFLGLINGETSQIRDYAVMGFFESHYRCVRTTEWSFIRTPDGKANELYHLVKDPQEKENLIEKAPEIAKELAVYIGRHYYGPPPTPFPNVQLKYEVSETPAQFWELLRKE